MRFVRYFWMMWMQWPSYRWFCDCHLGKEKFEEIMKVEPDKKRAERNYRSRFWYSWDNARIYWAHRERV